MKARKRTQERERERERERCVWGSSEGLTYIWCPAGIRSLSRSLLFHSHYFDRSVSLCPNLSRACTGRRRRHRRRWPEARVHRLLPAGAASARHIFQCGLHFLTAVKKILGSAAKFSKNLLDPYFRRENQNQDSSLTRRGLNENLKFYLCEKNLNFPKKSKN